MQNSFLRVMLTQSRFYAPLTDDSGVFISCHFLFWNTLPHMLTQPRISGWLSCSGVELPCRQETPLLPCQVPEEVWILIRLCFCCSEPNDHRQLRNVQANVVLHITLTCVVQTHPITDWNDGTDKHCTYPSCWSVIQKSKTAKITSYIVLKVITFLDMPLVLWSFDPLIDEILDLDKLFLLHRRWSFQDLSFRRGDVAESSTVASLLVYPNDPTLTIYIVIFFLPFWRLCSVFLLVGHTR